MERDDRFDDGEERFRAWGFIGGLPYFFAFTTRGSRVRAISLRRAHQRRLSELSHKLSPDMGDPNVEFDEDNPEWTEEDFKRAKPAHDMLPPEILVAFPRTRGAQAAAKKIPVSIRLSPQVVDYFKSQGPGWQSRIDEVLKKAAGL